MIPAVEFEGVARRYGSQYIFKDINLVLSAGKIIVLCGDNGAGKTTLLKLMSTRLRPSLGSGKIFGLDMVKQAHEVRRQLAYISVLGGHYLALSALENLRLAATLYQHDKKEVTHAELCGKLEAVGLLAVKDKLVRTFSSGMKKRLSIARLLLSDADLWLLDEPYAALDERGKTLVDDLLTTAKMQGRTVVMASHDLNRTASLVDSILQIENGRLSKYGVLTDAEVAHG